MNLHFKRIGDQTADKTIVFLHEGLGCIEMWKGYPEKLVNEVGCNGIVYDRSGYGKSPGDLTNRTNKYLHQAAEELADFLAFHKIENPILYGHSDGGSIAIIYAATHPENVSALITEAAHVFNEPETIQGVKEARPWLSEGKMEALKKYHGERYKEVFYAWNDIWLDDSFKDWNITALLPKITAPQLIIQGKDDQYGTLKQVDTIVSTTTGESHFLTPENCGHAPFKEQEAVVLKSVKEFINAN
ncbi:alpha/beta hydrolase [Paracrocinitomix mangrovi]|uniref:alpha/beta fold hydrolase n=1 Tax=Paracrocinitomix mangrovi TaxID=2862509 RepID=UPI001C8EB473|nr:alpha/beta hydrolase [Paracrocinitomix mangrovi]UKN01543.1 alpha/beta hydrolase [Paracrocinitomix mangrovi]